VSRTAIAIHPDFAIGDFASGTIRLPATGKLCMPMLRDFGASAKPDVIETTHVCEKFVLPQRNENPAYKSFSFGGFEKIVQRMRKVLGLPSHFTMDACRHGGMTELEEAELTDGQGRSLSGHKTRQSSAGYAKQTLARALPATRKRYAHRLSNMERTEFQNTDQNSLQNDRDKNSS
jgi:hypothetical protein